jgi:hypothetical protein
VSGKNLKNLIQHLFGDQPVHLDHDPALENRVKVFDENGRHVEYIPEANNSKYLVYRTIENHRTKTLSRGDGALRSDASQRRYLNRVAENRGLRRKKPSRKIANRKTKWPSRPFPNKNGG